MRFGYAGGVHLRTPCALKTRISGKCADQGNSGRVQREDFVVVFQKHNRLATNTTGKIVVGFRSEGGAGYMGCPGFENHGKQLDHGLVECRFLELPSRTAAMIFLRL